MATQQVSFVEEMSGFPAHVRSWLPRQAKLRIIELLATFHTVRQVQETIRAEFGRDLQSRDVLTYDPSSPRCRMGKTLRDHYEAVRNRYIERSAEVAIAHRAHRLRMLQTVVEKAEKAKDFANAIKGLELAAKEMGGVLEGKSEVKHVGQVAHIHLSAEDAKRELAMRLQEVIDGGALEALPSPDADTSDQG